MDTIYGIQRDLLSIVPRCSAASDSKSERQTLLRFHTMRPKKILRPSKCLYTGFLCLFVAIVLYYMYFCQRCRSFVKSDWDKPAKIEPAMSESAIAAALNRVRSGQVKCGQVQALFPDRIPPVIHWTNKDSQVLSKHRDLVRSWSARLGESAIYMLWDDAKIEQLLMRHYPELWQRFKHLRAGILLSDIGRLAIVHHVGGVYTDMDVRLLRNFFPLLRKHKSLWSQEPWEHAYYLYGRREMLSNALFMSRARHKFLEYVLLRWPRWFDKNWLHRPGNPLTSSKSAVAMTGPLMLNQFLDAYRLAFGNSTPTLAKPEAFQPWWDATSIPNFLRKQCVFTAIMPPEQRERCNEIRGLNSDSRRIPPDSYAVHLYLHTGYGRPLDYSGSIEFHSLLNASSCII